VQTIANPRRDDVLHDREAEPGAARRARRVGSVEALEQPLEIGGADARAVVGDRQPRAPGFLRHRDAARGPRTRIADRVRDEVLDHDAHHARAQGQLDLLTARHDDLDLGVGCALGERRDRLAHDGQDARSTERHDLAARLELAEEQHVVDQVARLLDLLPRLLDEAVDFRAGQGRRLEQHEEARQRRPQLVRDRSGEAGPELLIGGELGQRVDEQHKCPADVLPDAPTRHRVAQQRLCGRRRRHEPPLLVEHDDRLGKPCKEGLDAFRIRHHTFTIHSPSIDPSPHAPTR
jgi:hypothetical protein